jgi:hypothetical protein
VKDVSENEGVRSVILLDIRGDLDDRLHGTIGLLLRFGELAEGQNTNNEGGSDEAEGEAMGEV